MTHLRIALALIATAACNSPVSPETPDGDGDGKADDGTSDSSDGGVTGESGVSTCTSYPGPVVCGNAHWSWDQPTPTGHRLSAAWSFSPSDVWAAGGAGTVLHYDGQSWAVEQTPICEEILGLWGSSPTNLWAVGAEGRILHRTSSGWTILQSGTCKNLQAVWGASATDIWAVGDEHTVLHGGTQGFSAVAFPTTDHLRDIIGFASNDVWAVGMDGIYHFDGAAWSTAKTDNWALNAIWGSDSDHLFVAGFAWGDNSDAVWMFSKATVSTPTRQLLSGNRDPALRGTSANDVWFFSSNQGYHYDGTTWRSFGVGSTYPVINAVAAASPSDAWAVGESGQRLHWNGTLWSVLSEDHAIMGLWAAAANDVWAATGKGLLHWNGTAWSTVSGVTGFFDAVWGTSANDIWAVGLSKVVHWDGSTWSTITMPVSTHWYTVRGTSANDVWVGGYQGNLAHYNGTSWNTVSATTKAIYSIWPVTANDVWAATDSGLIRYNGSFWSATGPLDPGPMYRVRAIAPNEIWAAGRAVYHFDGNTWTQPLAAQWMKYFGVWGTSANDVWVLAGGDLGSPNHIMHWDGSAWTTHVNATSTRIYTIDGAGGHIWAGDLGGGIITYH